MLVGRKSANLDAAALECRATENQAHIVPCDTSCPLQVEQAARTQNAFLGPVRTLVNNAGIAQSARVEELTLESCSAQMNTNLLAPIWLTRALLPSMRLARTGTIINV